MVEMSRLPVKNAHNVFLRLDFGKDTDLWGQMKQVSSFWVRIPHDSTLLAAAAGHSAGNDSVHDKRLR